MGSISLHSLDGLTAVRSSLVPHHATVLAGRWHSLLSSPTFVGRGPHSTRSAFQRWSDTTQATGIPGGWQSSGVAVVTLGPAHLRLMLAAANWNPPLAIDFVLNSGRAGGGGETACVCVVGRSTGRCTPGSKGCGASKGLRVEGPEGAGWPPQRRGPADVAQVGRPGVTWR